MDTYVERYGKLSNVAKSIRENGIVVIPNVISKEKIKKYKKQLWNMFSDMTFNLQKPISRRDPKSWKNIYEMFPSHNMLIQHWKVGHSPLAWNIRQEEKVIQAFSNIWDVSPDELLVSFDGMSFHMPPEETERGWYNKNNDWYHTDQTNRFGFSCVQGMITLYDINEGDATFAYKERSNFQHSNFFEYTKIRPSDDWYKLTIPELDYFKRCPNRRIKAKAGSLILWDSRLFHCGCGPIYGRRKSNFRAVFYICMTPRDWSTEEDIKNKQKAFQQANMTTHNPNKIVMYPSLPRTYGSTIKSRLITDSKTVKLSDLSDIGKKLAGF